MLGRKKAAAVAIDDGPPFPGGVSYLWLWFHEISMGLTSNGWSPPIVTWEALASWCAVCGLQLDLWEINAIMRLSVLRASIEAERINKETRDSGGRSH